MSDFASRFRGGEQMVGLILKMANTSFLELSGLVGFDLVVLDTEHGPGDSALLEQHLMAADAVGVPVLVRVSANDSALIQTALDLGARGVIVPHVSDRDGAEHAASSAHYPPVGHRGLALTTRAARHGTVTIREHLAHSATTIVVVQVEDQAGVDEAAAIAAVSGIDGVWVGPNDLAASLGLEPNDRQVLDAGASVARDVLRANKTMLELSGNADDMAGVSKPFASVHLFTAHGLFAAASRQLISQVRAAAAQLPAQSNHA